jgi:hypothetical protein
MKNKELNHILDQVTAGIRAEQVDDATVSDATERVWAQLSKEVATSAKMEAAPADRIEGCADFQTLIPAYLGGKLSEARSLLLVDHTHECIPCRKALKQARESRVGAVAPAVRRQSRKAATYSLRPVVLRWGIAAALVIGLGLIALPLIQRYVPLGSFEATVQASDGPLYAVNDAQTRSLSTGEKLRRGDAIRTAKDAHAVVVLDDGSLIEMKDRSEFSISQTLRGTTLHLDRGSVIVEAAKQKTRQRTVVGKLLQVFFGGQSGGQFFVETGDSLVSVTGTTFAVNAGTKGSRVSVIEGQVHLDHAGDDKVLRAGEQATTNTSIERIPVKDEIAWSRNAARYAKALEGLTALQRELDAVAKPGVRYSTRLLDMMPQNTVLYAALPNLSATIAESNRIIEERIQENPALKDWFENRREPRGPGMNHAITVIREFGEQLGDELAVGAGMSDSGEPVEPIVLAELKNPAGFRAFFDAEVLKLAGQGKAPQVQWVEDPKTAQPAATTTATKGGDKQIYVWIAGDILVASPKLDQLQAVATRSGSFTSTPFHNRIAGVYREGAGLVIAADLEKVIAHTRGVRRIAVGDKHEEALNELGVFNMKSFVLDQKDSNGKTNTRAVLSYAEVNHGVTSWLAQPAPMGSLEYISPDANVVAGFVVKNPSALVDDLLGVLNTVSPDLNKKLAELQSDHGLDLRKDFAAPLGGEYAFAIDGPILPTPSWKLVFEVNDPAHLQQAFEHVVEEVNQQMAKEGKAGLAWDKSDASGHTYYTLRSKDFGVEVNYVFANGYLIAGPTRALVEQALKYHDSGVNLIHSARFVSGLPADGNTNFSALVYHNLAPLVQPFANRIPDSVKSDEQQKAIANIAANMQPTLAYAYAFGDRIEFASNSDGGPFGLSPATLLGMPNAFELQHILQQGMRGGAKK